MQKVIQRVFSLFIKANPLWKKNGHKTRAQSLVEVAIAFPVLIVLLSGVIEFGFILNYYLSLLDATRESARLYSNGDPFDPKFFRSPYGANTFYYDSAYEVQRILDPVIDKPSYKGRRIVLDPAIDDVIVSIYSATDSVAGGNVTLTGGPYHLFNNGKFTPIFGVLDIQNTRVSGAPAAGILMVEIHYNYHHVLGLPWMTTIISNPLHLRAYTIMPIRAGEPASSP